MAFPDLARRSVQVELTPARRSARSLSLAARRGHGMQRPVQDPAGVLPQHHRLRAQTCQADKDTRDGDCVATFEQGFALCGGITFCEDDVLTDLKICLTDSQTAFNFCLQGCGT